MIKEKLKQSPLLVSLYQKIIGYKAGAKHWCRVAMDDATDKLVRELPFSTFSTLEISGQKWKEFGFRDYQSVSFPDFDLCEKALPREFDLVIAEQVFEH